MNIEQIYTGCLAQGAYYITSGGEAAIIDPLREIKPYLARLDRDGVQLKYIFETHFHADFVSGHLDLSKKTGAPIVYGPTALPNFEFILATDGQVFKIGKVTIKVLHTPGHTMESTTYLLYDEQGKAYCIFSGDTLFIGDVGRPDLAQKSAHMTQEELAGILFHSLRDKIMTLPDEVIVYPAHGAGSACGKNMSKETVSTIGQQKQFNYALRSNMTEKEFIHEVTEGLLPPPAYFGKNVEMNKEGYESFDDVLNKGMHSLPPREFEVAAEETGALLLDTRKGNDFAQGHIPQSINIGLSGDFAPWVGALIADVKQPILLISEIGKEEESVTRLSRVGFDHVIGHLQGGFEAWKNAGFETDSMNRMSAEEFSQKVERDHPGREAEFESEHLEDALSKPLAYINDWIKDINPNNHFYMHCASGYRTMIASSILRARGYRNFTEVEGGINAIRKTQLPKSKYIHENSIA